VLDQLVSIVFDKRHARTARVEATHAQLSALLAGGVEPAIEEHGGRIVKNTGDGFLAEFPSAVEAVRAAMQFQTRIDHLTIGDLEDGRIAFRVGVNIGDVIVEPHDIFGDGVNIAARLERIAGDGADVEGRGRGAQGGSGAMPGGVDGAMGRAAIAAERLDEFISSMRGTGVLKEIRLFREPLRHTAAPLLSSSTLRLVPAAIVPWATMAPPLQRLGLHSGPLDLGQMRVAWLRRRARYRQ
jgi:hypothetical protein